MLVFLSLKIANAGSAADSLAARVTHIADQYHTALIEVFPENVTWFGLSAGRHDRLNDHTTIFIESWHRRQDQWLVELKGIDPDSLFGRPEWMIYGLLLEELEAEKAMRVCRRELWQGIHPVFGWHVDYSILANQQPVGSPPLRAQALKRWQKFPNVVEAKIANLRQGMRLHYRAHVATVRRVIEQLTGLVKEPARESPFYSPARRDTTADFRLAFGELVADDILPALQRYRDFLVTEYLPSARKNQSIFGNPDGASCYRAALRRYTTLELSENDIYELGMRKLAQAETEMRTLAETRFGWQGDPKQLLQRLQADSTATFISGQEALEHANVVVDRARRTAPRWFNRIPNTPLVVEAVPPSLEASEAPASYIPAAADTRPAIYYLNLSFNTAPGAALVIDKRSFHEGIPGHHLQIGLARELQKVHALQRYLTNDAFTEGWAAYAETLADEMGLYSSPAHRLRALDDRIYYSTTAIFEPGMHARGWTREQAIDFEVAHTSRTAERAAFDIDRRIDFHGQGLAVVVGYAELRRLRELAERILGSEFDIRQFHDRVLEDGVVTLAMLRTKIERWLDIPEK